MTKLVRTLRFRDLVLLIIGSIIGSGIFLVPGGLLRQVADSIGIASLVWIAGGVLSLLGALSAIAAAAELLDDAIMRNGLAHHEIGHVRRDARAKSTEAGQAKISSSSPNELFAPVWLR